MTRGTLSAMEEHPGRWLLLMAVLLLGVGVLLGGVVGFLAVRSVAEVLAQL